jgi:hypothetical protein
VIFLTYSIRFKIFGRSNCSTSSRLNRTGRKIQEQPNDFLVCHRQLIPVALQKCLRNRRRNTLVAVNESVRL